MRESGDPCSRATAAGRFFRFGPFGFCAVQRDLWHLDQPLAITPRLCDLLELFLEHPRCLLGKQWLLDQLWPGIYVTDNSLSQAVSALRRVLGCDGQRFIRTEARRGFRFICAVHVVQSGSTSFTPEALAQARAVTAPLTSYTVALESIDSSSPRPLNVMVPAASCLPR
jgi:DNA-binding winged helix-turn-helix (wHTH) protein